MARSYKKQIEEILDPPPFLRTQARFGTIIIDEMELKEKLIRGSWISNL